MGVAASLFSVEPDSLIETRVRHAGVVTAQAVESLKRVRRQRDAALLTRAQRRQWTLGRIVDAGRPTTVETRMQGKRVMAASNNNDSAIGFSQRLTNH